MAAINGERLEDSRTLTKAEKQHCKDLAANWGATLTTADINGAEAPIKTHAKQEILHWYFAVQYGTTQARQLTIQHDNVRTVLQQGLNLPVPKAEQHVVVVQQNREPRTTTGPKRRRRTRRAKGRRQRRPGKR